eukprot:2569330-Pyramimonas_sp.AAC.1
MLMDRSMDSALLLARIFVAPSGGTPPSRPPSGKGARRGTKGPKEKARPGSASGGSWGGDAPGDLLPDSRVELVPRGPSAFAFAQPHRRSAKREKAPRIQSLYRYALGFVTWV